MKVFEIKGKVCAIFCATKGQATAHVIETKENVCATDKDRGGWAGLSLAEKRNRLEEWFQAAWDVLVRWRPPPSELAYLGGMRSGLPAPVPDKRSDYRVLEKAQAKADKIADGRVHVAPLPWEIELMDTAFAVWLSLPPEDQEIMGLRMAGLGYRRIGKRLGLNYETARRRRNEALDKMLPRVDDRGRISGI